MRTSTKSAGIVTATLATITLVLAACSTKTAPAQVEIRLAELAPGGELTATTSRGGLTVYVYETVAFTGADFTDAALAQDNLGRPAVTLTLTDAAAARLETMSRAHLDRPVAMMVNGECVAAPVVRSPLSRLVMITGLSEGEAQGLVDDLGIGS